MWRCCFWNRSNAEDNKINSILGKLESRIEYKCISGGITTGPIYLGYKEFNLKHFRSEVSQAATILHAIAQSCDRSFVIILANDFNEWSVEDILVLKSLFQEFTAFPLDVILPFNLFLSLNKDKQKALFTAVSAATTVGKLILVVPYGNIPQKEGMLNLDFDKETLQRLSSILPNARLMHANYSESERKSLKNNLMYLENQAEITVAPKLCAANDAVQSTVEGSSEVVYSGPRL